MYFIGLGVKKDGTGRLVPDERVHQLLECQSEESEFAPVLVGG
jgi:hypothetical protein